MKSIRWKLVFIYLVLVFIVMLISGTFIIMQFESQENEKARSELVSCATYIEEQIIKAYSSPEEFQDGFTELFSQRSLVNNIQGSILNAQGTTVASTNASDTNNLPVYTSDTVITALSGKKSFSPNVNYTDQNKQTKNYLAYADPVFDSQDKVEYVVYVQMDSDAVRENVRHTINTIVMSVFLALALTAFLGLLFANTITGPIQTLTKKADLLAEGDLAQHIIVKSNDEIGQLTRSFNYMARELRKTVLEMENENSKLEIILQNMADGVLAFDEYGILIHINKVCRELLELDDRDISYEQFLNMLNISKKELKPNRIKEIVLLKNDKYINAAVIPYMGKERRLEGIVCVLQDITKMRRLDDMRKEFVANVSHEIRTPITNIKSYTETLLEGALDDRETAEDFLNEINSAADRMKFLTDDLLELSRLDDRRIQFRYNKENLYEIVASCVRQNKILAENKNQNIITSEPESKNMEVYVDIERINQVINNILSNAIKYSGENTDINVSLFEEDGKYCVCVKDNGIGIPKDDLGRIFERFYRVDKARSRAMGGNGLGLSIAKEMMEGHGGTIKASSRPGHGTAMTIIFLKYEDGLKRVEGTSNI